MIRSALLFSLLAALTLPGISLRAALPLPLQDGEKLTYRVSWAILPGAGEIKISAAHEDTSAGRRLVVTTDTATKGFAKALMRFHAEAKSVFDLRTGDLLSLEESSQQPDKSSAHSVKFDLATRQATYFPGADPSKVDPGKTRLLPIPPGDPLDLIMALLQTRSWDLKPGEKRDALVLFDDDFYELTIHMARYEDVRTPMGKFKTIVLEPRMDKTAPKGMFKRGSSVRVWISQDQQRLPVKFEVEFKLGTGTATLEAYEGPATFAMPTTPAPVPAASGSASPAVNSAMNAPGNETANTPASEKMAAGVSSSATATAPAATSAPTGTPPVRASAKTDTDAKDPRP